MYFAGAAASALGVKVTANTHEARVAQAAAALAFALCGVILCLIKPRRWVLESNVFVAIAILGGLIARSNPLGTAPLFILWPVVFAAYFLRSRLVVLTYSWAAACLAVALVLNPHHQLKMDTFVGTSVCGGLMAMLVAAMNRREEALRDALERTAATDPLTGLSNRRSFNPELAAMICQSLTDSRPLALVMFDLDHFKRFNDTHGHMAGDVALQRMAQVLREQSRPLDAVSRFGGEEFAVALPGCNAEHALAYAERVATALAQAVEPDWRLSTSAGIGTLDSGATTVDEVLALADAALYAAKEAGRGRGYWWDGNVPVGRAFPDAGRTDTLDEPDTPTPAGA